jgi:hypothetical protein
MIFRALLIAYCVGGILGFLGMVEWLVDRASKVWLVHLGAAVLSFTAGLIFWVADRRRNPR